MLCNDALTSLLMLQLEFVGQFLLLLKLELKLKLLLLLMLLRHLRRIRWLRLKLDLLLDLLLLGMMWLLELH